MIFVVVGCLFLVVPVLILATHRRLQRRHRERLDTWTPGTADVVGLESRSEGDATDLNGPTLLYAPVLRFVLPDGQVVETVSHEWQTPPAARPGAQVEIRYDPTDPRRAIPAHTQAQAYASGLVTVVGSCLMVGLGLIGIGLIVLGVWLRSSGGDL